MFKKIIALLSAAAMLLSFAACGGNQEETTTTEKSKDTVATELVTDNEGEVVTDEDGEKVTVTVADKTEKNETTDKNDKTTNPENSTTEKTTKDNNNKPTKPSTTEPTKNNNKPSKPSTKAEIIDYYNKAVNKVKSEAKSVVKFYDNSTNYKGLVEAWIFSDIGKILMDRNLKENNERKQYSGTEIVANFPVRGQKTSNITVDAVKTATCEDKGSYYEITLIANCSESKPDINPTKGGGIVGKMFNILELKDVVDAVGGMLKFKGTEFIYEGGKLIAHIDKATGKMTYLYTDLPMILSLMVGSFNPKVGLEFENKWEINW